MYTGTGVIIVILAMGGSKMVRVLTREICKEEELSEFRG
jgi:hypothetical protein